MPSNVRVVLGMLPPLLGGLVRRLLAAEPGISVVGEARDRAALAEAVRTHRPHAVVLEMDAGGLPADFCGLLCEAPALTWIAVARDHSRATVHVLRSDALADLGPRDLVSAIRSAAPGE